MRQLWRRIAFSVAVNNTDDHLRNHGFLRRGGGWALAPLFDVNPNPDPAAQRVTSVLGSTNRAGCLDALFAVRDSFEIGRSEAYETWDALRGGVAQWRAVAGANGIAPSEQRQFADVLDATRDLTSRPSCSRCSPTG